MSFTATIKEHKKASALRRKELDKARDAAAQAVEGATGALLTDISRSVSHINAAQQRLEREARTLQAQTANLQKQTQKWIGAYKSLNESLKQLGDVANWSSVVEADMRFIARVLDNSVTVAQGTSTSSTPSSSSPAPSTTPSTSTSTNASSSSVTPS